MDLVQIMSFLPAVPAKVLDVGCGSGWTSEFFAKTGYETGIDISPDMIALATRRNCSALFVSDYVALHCRKVFDAAVFYGFLHHADNEYLAIKNVFDALSPGGYLGHG